MKQCWTMLICSLLLSIMLLACSLGGPAPSGGAQPTGATASPEATLPPLAPGTETNPTRQPPTVTPTIEASATPTPTATVTITPTATTPPISTGPLAFMISIVSCRLDPTRDGGVILTLRFDATGGNGVYTYYREDEQVPRTFDRPATKGSAVIDAFRVDSGDGQSIQRKERFTAAQFGCP